MRLYHKTRSTQTHDLILYNHLLRLCYLIAPSTQWQLENYRYYTITVFAYLIIIVRVLQHVATCEQTTYELCEKTSC